MVNYLQDQVELYGNELMYSGCNSVSEIRQIMSLIHLFTNSTIFKGADFADPSDVKDWHEHYAEILSLDNLDLMNEIVKKMHFTCCIEMIKLFPKGVNPQNLNDTLCIIMAMV